MFLLISIGVLFIFYAGLIFFYDSSWKDMPDFEKQVTKSASVKFSVIISARNEEKNIGKLLKSLQTQNYSKEFFEVIVVDDHSTDKTAEIAKKYASPPAPFPREKGVILLQLNSDQLNSYKKKAIETGINAAQNEWIVCTDADCVVPENWLATYASFITENDPVFVAAPVNLIPGPLPAGEEGKMLYTFQALDFMTLQGITGASVFKKVHSMCNGANLAYKKDIFYEVNGFEGVDDIASGDDMLLMHKIWKKYPEKVAYLKSKGAIIETLAAPTLRDFLNQRIRWASKAKYYDDKRIFWVLVLVYLFNFSFLILAVTSFFNPKYCYALIILWLAKTIIELPFIISISKFFNQQTLLKYFFFFQPLHIAYTIISGFLGSFGKYEWKGRRVK